MTKSQIIKQVEQKKYQALKVVKAEFAKKIQDREEEVYKELRLDGTVDLLEACIGAASRYAKDFKDLVESKRGTVYSSYGFFHDMEYYDNNIRSSILSNIIIKDDEITRLKSMRDSQVENIEEAYGAVVGNLKNLSTAKKCIDYLESLEFDTNGMITESVKETTALAVIVDKTYLIVK